MLILRCTRLLFSNPVHGRELQKLKMGSLSSLQVPSCPSSSPSPYLLSVVPHLLSVLLVITHPPLCHPLKPHASPHSRKPVLQSNPLPSTLTSDGELCLYLARSWDLLFPGEDRTEGLTSLRFSEQVLRNHREINPRPYVPSNNRIYCYESSSKLEKLVGL